MQQIQLKYPVMMITLTKAVRESNTGPAPSQVWFYSFLTTQSEHCLSSSQSSSFDAYIICQIIRIYPVMSWTFRSPVLLPFLTNNVIFSHINQRGQLFQRSKSLTFSRPPAPIVRFRFCSSALYLS